VFPGVGGVDQQILRCCKGRRKHSTNGLSEAGARRHTTESSKEKAPGSALSNRTIVNAALSRMQYWKKPRASMSSLIPKPQDAKCAYPSGSLRTYRGASVRQ
jgi:hypothetical protein